MSLSCSRYGNSFREKLLSVAPKVYIGELETRKRPEWTDGTGSFKHWLTAENLELKSRMANVELEATEAQREKAELEDRIRRTEKKL